VGTTNFVPWNRSREDDTVRIPLFPEMRTGGCGTKMNTYSPTMYSIYKGNGDADRKRDNEHWIVNAHTI